MTRHYSSGADRAAATGPIEHADGERCPRCDRAECPWPAAWRATEGIPGFGEDRTPEDDAKWSALGLAVLACNPLTADQWRSRALAAEALHAEEARSAAVLYNFILAIGARIGARELGYGGQTVEAGEARYRAGIAKRIDRLLAAETERDRLRADVTASLALLDAAIGRAHRTMWSEPLEFFGDAGKVAASLRAALATAAGKEADR